jgi:hypothetical protein
MDPDLTYIDANADIPTVITKFFEEGSILVFESHQEFEDNRTEDVDFICVAGQVEPLETKDLNTVIKKGNTIWQLMAVFNHESGEIQAIVPTVGQCFAFSKIKNGSKCLYRRKMIVAENLLYYKLKVEKVKIIPKPIEED